MKKAFTLMELVIVLVVIGILSAAIIPRTKSNSLHEAGMEFISAIRYTQHLAMISDKYDPTDENWYKGRWQFLYSKSDDTGGYYAITIFSDSGTDQDGNPEIEEMALNSLVKSKLMSGGYSGELDWEDSKATKKLNIGYRYGITDITSEGCKQEEDKDKGNRVLFDNKGRPFVGDYYENDDRKWKSRTDGILTTQCIFTLKKDADELKIYIEPETGYTHL